MGPRPPLARGRGTHPVTPPTRRRGDRIAGSRAGAPEPMAICVTGGSSGIGRAIVERFAEPGNHVFVNYHANDAAAEDTPAGAEAAGSTAHLVKFDLTTSDGALELMGHVREHVDRLDQ